MSFVSKKVGARTDKSTGGLLDELEYGIKKD